MGFDLATLALSSRECYRARRLGFGRLSTRRACRSARMTRQRPYPPGLLTFRSSLMSDLCNDESAAAVRTLDVKLIAPAKLAPSAA
jgi:hypothetical protein